MFRKYIIILLPLFLSVSAVGQDKKVWASGAARSVFQQNNMETAGDTVTPRKLNSGHALVDLAINAKPNSQTYLHAMVRIRNDFGGFWGSGITFDMRQLYLKGLIRDAIRYQLGDIDYKLTEYTFYNPSEELSNHQSEALDIYRDMLHYDMFYTKNNTRRQQGAATDFTVMFPKFAEELQVNAFVFRNRPSDFGQQSDRIFLGGNASLLQSDRLSLGLNYIDLMDIKGTSRATTSYHNPVISGTSNIFLNLKKLEARISTESGISDMYVLNEETAPSMRDYFYDLKVDLQYDPKFPKLTVNYINVGPQFRSVGAQSRRLNFEGLNMMYGRYGNDQSLRPITQLDMIQDASLYRANVETRLQNFAPQYDNVQPYGKATPNRAGFIFGLDYNLPNQAFQLKGNYQMLSEIVGQGVEDLRKFAVFDVTAMVDIDTLLPNYKRALELTFGVSNKSTTRTTQLAEGNIDLQSSALDMGFKVGLSNDFAFLFNYKIINASGNELLSVRNDYTEVVDFEVYKTNMKQNLMLFALRYHFDAKSQLNLVWQKLNWNDDTSMFPEFKLNQFGIVYSMNF